MADESGKVTGKIKEGAGRLTGDENLESEGRTQEHKEQTKQNVEEGLDKARGAVEGVKEKFQSKS